MNFNSIEFPRIVVSDSATVGLSFCELAACFGNQLERGIAAAIPAFVPPAAPQW